MKPDLGVLLRQALGIARDRTVDGATRVVRDVVRGVRSLTQPPTAGGAERSPAPPATPPVPPAAEPVERPSTPQDETTQPRPNAFRTPRPARPRLPIGEAIRAVQAGRVALATLGAMVPTPMRAPVAPPLPAGARWLSRSHTCAAGTRDYRLYVPASAPKRPRGLVVMLHGCKQDADDFALGTGMNAVAEARGFLVAYPEQIRSANMLSCWNWFRPEDQERDGGEPEILAGLTRALRDEFHLDRARVFVAGLSAGAAMAIVLGETHPDLFAAVGSHSGMPYKAATDGLSALDAMREGSPRHRLGHAETGAPHVRTIVFQGRNDRTVEATNAERIVAEACPVQVTRQRSEGHTADGRPYLRTLFVGDDGKVEVEYWLIDDLGHAWSGGRAEGSFTDPAGPDAAGEMMRFFLGEPRRA